MVAGGTKPGIVILFPAYIGVVFLVGAVLLTANNLVLNQFAAGKAAPTAMYKYIKPCPEADRVVATVRSMFRMWIVFKEVGLQ